MKIDAHLNLEEFATALRQYVARNSGMEAKTITVFSYDQPRIIIDETGLIECTEFKHRETDR